MQPRIRAKLPEISISKQKQLNFSRKSDVEFKEQMESNMKFIISKQVHQSPTSKRKNWDSYSSAKIDWVS